MAATAAIAPAPAATHRGALTHPVVDFLCAGGLSVVALAVIQLLLPLDGNPTRIAATHVAVLFAWIQFAVNWPHFLITYQILYWDNRRELLKRRRFIWAGIVAPALMLGCLLGGALFDPQRVFAVMVQVMFVLVGWHYVKQAYGVAVVLAAKSGWYLTPMERRVARAAMYALWALNFVGIQVGWSKFGYSGIDYLSFGLKPWMLTAAYVVAGVTASALVAMVVRKGRVEGKTPPLNSMVSMLAIYVWFIPAAHHPVFFLMIPFFHSLQYLLFSVTMTVNRAKQRRAQGQSSTSLRLATYLLHTIVAGALLSTTVPWLMDSHISYDTALYGTAVWAFAFTWFINVHHYLMDNQIWRADAPGVKQYL